MVKKDKLKPNLTPELIEEAQKRIDFIAKEGCTKPGVNEEIDSSSIPEWYDEVRFKRAQSLFQEHYTAVLNNQIVGLILFLQLPVGLAPLLATGRSKNSLELFRRYFSTVQYVDEWYYNDPFDPKSRACRTLSNTRSMHANAGKMMNSKISVFDFSKRILKETNPNIKDEEVELYIRNKDRVWVSQYDMTLILWAFIGCLTLEPEACGLHNCTRELIEDLYYGWQVLSHKLGIDPKYSLVEEANYDLVYAMCKIILEQEYLLHMENHAAPTGIRMSEGFLTVFKDILKGSNCNVYLKYWYKVLNVNSYKLNRETYEHDKMELFKISNKNQLTDEEKQTMLKNGFNDKYIVTDPSVPFEEFKLNGMKERILYKLYSSVVSKLLKYESGRHFTRDFIRNKIFDTRKNQKKIEANLLKKDGKRFEFSECPFTGKIDTKYYPDIYQEELKLKSTKE